MEGKDLKYARYVTLKSFFFFKCSYTCVFIKTQDSFRYALKNTNNSAFDCKGALFDGDVNILHLFWEW